MSPWLWTGLFVICGAAALCFLTWVSGVPRSGAFVEYNLERLESYADAGRGGPDGARRVILLGTSRLKYATRNGEELGRRVSQATGVSVQVIGIYNNMATFEDFVPLGQAMLRARPDAILLQVEMLAGEPFEPNTVGRFQVALRYLRWWLVGTGPWQPDSETPWEVQSDRPCEENFTRGRYNYRVQFPQRMDLGGSNAVLANDFIRAAVDQGVSVILLAVPKYPVLEQARPSLPPSLEGLIEKLTASSRQVELWRYPTEVPSDGYCDFLHMNESGREAYSGWIAARIAELIGRTPFDVTSDRQLQPGISHRATRPVHGAGRRAQDVSD